MHRHSSSSTPERASRGAAAPPSDGPAPPSLSLSLSAEVELAQREAETECHSLALGDRDEAGDGTARKTAELDGELPPIPKLLQLGNGTDQQKISELAAKTHDLMARGKMLDLLVCKAESYSHFIKSNLVAHGGHLQRSREKDDHADKGRLAGKSDDSTAISHADRKRKAGGGAHASPKGVASPGRGSKARKHADDSATSVQDDYYLLNKDIIAPDLTGRLMEYQVEGIRWLASLWENGVSGILADEMGLGKTIQVISFLALLKHRNTKGPFLVVAPLATIPNWLKEFRKWLPQCTVVLYHGSREEREAIRREQMPMRQQESPSFPVIITSFEICMVDRAHLQNYYWKFLVLDEGHRIKNRNCRLVRELKQLQSATRLLLSGTPIQNSLEELWSLLNFVNPAIFDSLEVFQSWFNFRNIGRETQVGDIIGQEQHDRIVSKLHEILRPFLLRRLKKDVLLTMPPKLEIVVYCGSSYLQREYCKHIRDGTLREALIEMGVEGAKDISQTNMLMNLRKACNHPFLFGEPRTERGEFIGESDPSLLRAASGKFQLLGRMLPRLKSGGHKVLIFSQMTKLLDILQDYLDTLGYSYCRIDGQVKVLDRQESIERFNSDPNMFVFLLSTRAGGLGINLQSADTCIIFDSDWNPHQDSQAQDRCHRIGQDRPVVVYRLLTADSVEIDVMEKQISKKKLDRLTISAGNFSQAGERTGGSLTLRRLKELLEDDVKNLARMTGSSNSATSTGGSARTERRFESISDAELDLILNRRGLFPSMESATQEAVEADDVCGIPLEGDMYDVVIVSDQGGMLHSLC